MQAFVRWRPLSSNEVSTGEIERSSIRNDNSRFSTSIGSPSSSSLDRSWKSAACFARTFEGNDGNQEVFEAVVKPALPQVLNGKTCNFFAYGHSGSGKTHTIIGYNYEKNDAFGLCLAAAFSLCATLEEINDTRSFENEDENRLGIGIRMYEMRKNSAFDLLNGRRECFVREGPDGKVHIRGETEMLDDGKVRVRPVTTKACWTFDEVRQELQAGLRLRATGSSTVHDQSSRTHAVLELEIVTKAIIEAHEAIIERESEFVPVAKRATDIYIEESQNAYIKTPDGKYVVNPDNPPNQERIDEAEREKEKFESYVKAAEARARELYAFHPEKCLGGKLVFVDLAGSEYYHEKATSSSFGAKMSPKERQEGRQINTDLLALKEVIRARALNQTRIPFRSSPLTMVLREHFSASTDSHSAMILTVSPSLEQFAATMNTLKYGNLVGVASGEKTNVMKK